MDKKARTSPEKESEDIDWEEVAYIARELIEEYNKRGIRPILRQIFYLLVANRIIKNNQRSYKRLSEVLTEHREWGLEALGMNESQDNESSFEVSWGLHPLALQDTSRRVIGGDSGYSSLREFLDKLLQYMEKGYSRKRWDSQPKQVIIWLEKESLAQLLEDIAEKYGVKLVPTRGYASFTTLYENLVEEVNPDKPLVVLLLTDFDPSGQDMVRDLHIRVPKYLYLRYNMESKNYRAIKISRISDEKYKIEAGIEIKKVALTKRQVIEYNLPPIPAKKSDSRYEWFTKAYGDKTTELEALPPEVLRQLVEEAIVENIDVDAWKEVQRKEKEEKERIKEIVQKLRETLESELS